MLTAAADRDIAVRFALRPLQHVGGHVGVIDLVVGNRYAGVLLLKISLDPLKIVLTHHPCLRCNAKLACQLFAGRPRRCGTPLCSRAAAGRPPACRCGKQHHWGQCQSQTFFEPFFHNKSPSSKKHMITCRFSQIKPASYCWVMVGFRTGKSSKITIMYGIFVYNLPCSFII